MWQPLDGNIGGGGIFLITPLETTKHTILAELYGGDTDQIDIGYFLGDRGLVWYRDCVIISHE